MYKGLDIIVPVLNEAGNIKPLVTRIHNTLYRQNISYRIIFVDDHSTDNTVAEIIKLSKNYPLYLHYKKGKKGKAWSILEGAGLSDREYVAMIDGDLQYPPEVLPELLRIAEKNGLAIANRKKQNISILRKLGTAADRFIFGRFLHGLSVDTQSGLKVFKREIISHIEPEDVTGWTLDLSLIHTTQDLGYKIGSLDIDFFERVSGQSKINFLKAAKEISTHSLSLKLKQKKVYPIEGKLNSSRGSGVAYKGKRFITHNKLPHHQSALKTFDPWQKLTFFAFLTILSTGLFINFKSTAIVVLGILTLIYFLDLLLNLYVLLKSLHFPPEIKFDDEVVAKINDSELPTYTVLVPLYKEAEVLPQFVEAINNIDWPKNKLDVQLLLEEDDTVTQKAARLLDLPSYFKIVVVPHSFPKTKPKACNYGLWHAKGEFTVVYDAEDKPEKFQLKKTYLAFKISNEKVVCLQSKLNYFNPDHNLLTRLFTAEYSLWFNLILPGLQSIDATIPLGGTSNHFRTKVLQDLHGWDAFNVTEDCDLGTRLFKAGYKTAIIDSFTLEEANTKLKSWIRQRSRWIKGYLQTYLVHTRNPIQFFKTHGIQSLIFQLVVGMRMTFILINPILWLTTISYFVFYSQIGEFIESLFPPLVFYPAVLLLVFGNFMYFYNYMIGLAKYGNWHLIKYVFIIPFYWLLTSLSAAIAFKQLFTKPHYWEKTEHGQNLTKKFNYDSPKATVKVTVETGTKPSQWKIFDKSIVGGGILIVSSVAANFSNFLYNAYLGRSVSIEEFGTVSLLSSIYSLVAVFASSFGKTVNHKSAFLLGKYRIPVKKFVNSVFFKSAVYSFVTFGFWLVATPFMVSYFNLNEGTPFLLFSPLWLILLPGSALGGFLMGNFKFVPVAATILIEALSKLTFTYIFVNTGNSSLVYFSIPLSIFLSFLLTIVFYISSKNEDVKRFESEDLKFPAGFFSTSILTGFAGVSFLTLDVILAKHFLSAFEAGQYALVSLSGKLIYFLSGLTSQFLIPVLSKAEGSKQDSGKKLRLMLLMVGSITAIGYGVFGLFADISLPLLFGEKVRGITEFMPKYGIAMLALVLSGVFVTYHQVKKHYTFPLIAFSFAFSQVLLIYLKHSDIKEIVDVVTNLALIQLAAVLFLHFTYGKFLSIKINFRDFLNLFSNEAENHEANKLRVLIYNWRDKKHVWAGGAETYVHEIAKRLVAAGVEVTVFCGNDRKSKMDEEIDGYKVVRRGGFYTVYLWAALYYIFKFRGKFDLIIDCENGIPFFTPLYSRLPKILVIHHIHKEVHSKHLPLPLATIAIFLEEVLMPRVYKNAKVVTVSESSRNDIVNLGMADFEAVNIVYNGINKENYKVAKKTVHPSFLYFGRLQPYKNIDIAISAFAKVLETYPAASLTIAGFGESLQYLKKLVETLNISHAVSFSGYVSEKQKSVLLSKSWVLLQPSSFEGWGITVIEANVSGTTVIASNVNGLKDSVINEVTGVLVESGNIEAWANAMAGLIKFNKFRKELSRNAYKWSDNFSWDRSAQMFLELIYETVDESDYKSARFGYLYEK